MVQAWASGEPTYIARVPKDLICLVVLDNSTTLVAEMIAHEIESALETISIDQLQP